MAQMTLPRWGKEVTPLSEEYKEPLIEDEDTQPDIQEEKGRPGRELYEWLQMVLTCVMAAVLVFNCFARLTRVDGGSMDNTLQDGELMLVWSLGYTPRQGDIIVLNKTTTIFPGRSESSAIVKRVIATENQVVDIDYGAGVVYVDGQHLDEPYIKEEMYYPLDMPQTHWDVPEDCIFVMGDNRNASTDSRSSLLGPIHEDYVLGKAVLSLWPLSRFGLL